MSQPPATPLASLADLYMDLKALSAYSGLSVRTLRDHLDDPEHPLSCFRVKGKILIRKSVFDGWIAQFETVGRPSVTDTLKAIGLA